MPANLALGGARRGLNTRLEGRAQSPAATGSTSPGYLPEVDGLRALAALGVAGYHLGLLPGGWAGVWLFFVLSGFVITHMLVASDWVFSARTYISFCQKRAARIWPLYFLYGTITVFLEFSFGHVEQLLPHVLGLLTFTYNFQSPHEHITPLYGIMWTLSIEQQFYLFFPLIFMPFLRNRRRSLVVGLIGLSFSLRVVEFFYARHAGLDNLATHKMLYFWSPGQFDAFGVGALIALHARNLQNSSVIRKFMAIALIFIGCVVLYNCAMAYHLGMSLGRHSAYTILVRPFAYPGSAPSAVGAPITAFAVIVVASAMALAAAIGPDSIVRRALRWKPLVQVGRISYGLYIWQMPIIAGMFALFGSSIFTAPTPLRVALAAPCVALSIAAAYISYHFYESRFHKRIGTRPAAPATSRAASTSPARF